ncbi:MAG: Fluoride ion transporter CrcB, partial [uncultured Thermomicrobiales bacterium]
DGRRLGRARGGAGVGCPLRRLADRRPPRRRLRAADVRRQRHRLVRHRPRHGAAAGAGGGPRLAVLPRDRVPRRLHHLQHLRLRRPPPDPRGPPGPGGPVRRRHDCGRVAGVRRWRRAWPSAGPL